MPDLLETDFFSLCDLFSRALDLIKMGFIGKIVEVCNLYIIFFCQALVVVAPRL